jgi:hypothetical protein
VRSDLNFYAVLSVDPTATSDQLRVAYRQAAKANHPDRFASYVQRLRATGRMQEINHAYAVLQDPERRRAYDAERKSSNPDPPPIQASNRHRAGVPSRAAAVTSSNGERWWIFGWLVASGVVAFAYAHGLESISPLGYIGILLASLFFTPLVLMTVGFALAVPVLILAGAFRESFDERQAGAPAGPWRLFADFTVRAAILGVLCYLLVSAIRNGVASDLLYFLLLAGIGSMAGEVSAMLMYLVRRRKVVSATNALVRLDAVKPIHAR